MRPAPSAGLAGLRLKLRSDFDFRRCIWSRARVERLASAGTWRSLPGLSLHAHRMEVGMTDPRDFDRRMDMERQAEMEMERRMRLIGPWGLIAAAVLIVVVLALLFAGSESTRTARENTSPPATTGQSGQ